MADLKTFPVCRYAQQKGLRFVLLSRRCRCRTSLPPTERLRHDFMEFDQQCGGLPQQASDGAGALAMKATCCTLKWEDSGIGIPQDEQDVPFAMHIR